MRHAYFIRNISAYADGRLDEKRSREFKEHLDKCPACAALYKDIMTAKNLASIVEIEKRTEEFDAKVEEAVSREMEAEARKEGLAVGARVEAALTALGDYIWTSVALKKGLALATVSLLILIGIGIFNNYQMGFRSIVVACRGPVSVYRAAEDRWIDARPGLEVRSKDMVRLGKYAQVDIESRKLFEIRLKQDSEVYFERLARRRNADTDILVKAGTIMVNTNPDFEGSSMKVVTPTSKTTVLGTTFMIDVNPLQAGTTWVGVVKGQVAVEGINVPKEMEHLNRVILEKGKKTYVRPGEVPTIPEIFSDKEWEAMDELYRIGDLPQVALLIGTGSGRVEELMKPCMLYIYDAKPRKLHRDFDTVVRDIKKAVEKDDTVMHRKAARKLKALVDKYPNPKYDVQFYLFLGAYNYFIGDYDQALSLFNRIIDDIPDSRLVSLAMCAKAIVYERGLKVPEKAKKIYDKILTFYPDTPEAEYARRALRQ